MAIASVSVQQALAVLVDTWFEQDGNHADAPRVSTRGLFIDPPPSVCQTDFYCLPKTIERPAAQER